jgi:outer membrane protein assembly factor BamD
MRRRPLLRAWAVLVLVAASGACASKKKKEESFQPKPALETFQSGLEALSKRNLRQARERLSSIEYEAGSPERGEIEPLARLALADATFYGATAVDYISARGLYLDFVTLYGNHRLAPYAQTQAGLASLEQVNHPTKDQSQTRQAIADFDEVVRRWPDSSFASAARGLRRVARANLADAEFLVGNYYLTRKSWRAAIDRFKGILRDYPDYPELDRVRYHLGRALINGGNSVEGQLILDRLVAESPDSEWAEPARRLLENRPQPSGSTADAAGAPSGGGS